jgi:DNA repair protein RecN (Recombination protein N)
VVLDDCDLFGGGVETVEYLVSSNAGEAPRPLSKVASGGELSRISLALHLLTSSGMAETMVFDEVDAGVGGAAAQAIGRALADLSARTSSQVVVVTHLPQVAVFADRHLRVTKAAVGGRMTAVVEEVDGEARVAELSRMLAGLPESKRARDHAKELLDLASGKVGTG